MLHLVWPALCKYGLSPWKRKGVIGCLFLHPWTILVSWMNQSQRAPGAGHLCDKDVEAVSAQHRISWARRGAQILGTREALLTAETRTAGTLRLCQAVLPTRELAAVGLSQGWFYPRGHTAKSGDVLVVPAGRMLLGSSRQRPRMLLNIRKHTGLLPSPKSCLAQDISRTKAEKPWSRACPQPCREKRSTKSSLALKEAERCPEFALRRFVRC